MNLTLFWILKALLLLYMGMAKGSLYDRTSEDVGMFLWRDTSDMEIHAVALKAVERYNKQHHPNRIDLLLEIVDAQSREAVLGEEFLMSIVVGVTGCSVEERSNCSRRDVEFVDFLNIDALKTNSMKEFVFTFQKMK